MEQHDVRFEAISRDIRRILDALERRGGDIIVDVVAYVALSHQIAFFPFVPLSFRGSVFGRVAPMLPKMRCVSTGSGGSHR